MHNPCLVVTPEPEVQPLPLTELCLCGLCLGSAELGFESAVPALLWLGPRHLALKAGSGSGEGRQHAKARLLGLRGWSMVHVPATVPSLLIADQANACPDGQGGLAKGGGQQRGPSRHTCGLTRVHLAASSAVVMSPTLKHASDTQRCRREVPAPPPPPPCPPAGWPAGPLQAHGGSRP